MPYQKTDTTSNLLDTIVARTNLDSFFTQPLLLVATIRNRLSRSHGAGAVPKQVSPQIAQFAMNSTAAAILLMVKEALWRIWNPLQVRHVTSGCTWHARFGGAQLNRSALGRVAAFEADPELGSGGWRPITTGARRDPRLRLWGTLRPAEPV